VAVVGCTKPEPVRSDQKTAPVVASPKVADGPKQPSIFGVLSTPDGTSSELVRFVGDGSKTLVRFEHARGWAPEVALVPDLEVAFAAVVSPGKRHGADAELVRIGLADGARTTVAKAVPARQRPILRGADPVFTEVLSRKPAADGGQDLAELVLVDGAHRWSQTAYLLWPLFIVGDAVVTLVVDPAGSRLYTVTAGQPALIRDFGQDPTRDFSLSPDGSAIVHQRQVQQTFRVERTGLDGSVTVLHEDRLPWLAPLATKSGVLISRSTSPTSGALVRLHDGAAKTVELGGAGAPIPLASSGAVAVVRLQQPGAQAYLRVDLSSDSAKKLPTGGRLLTSVVLAP